MSTIRKLSASATEFKPRLKYSPKKSPTLTTTTLTTAPQWSSTAEHPTDLTSAPQCLAMTSTGRQCCFSASGEKKTCKIHSTQCENLYNFYKQVCALTWNAKCLANSSDETLKYTAFYASKCLELRENFALACCENMSDKGHCGAMKKMDNLVTKCNGELERRYEKSTRR